MAKIVLILVALIVLASICNPGWIIGTIIALINWALFEIAWWQLLLLAGITVATTRYVCYLIKRAKK